MKHGSSLSLNRYNRSPLISFVEQVAAARVESLWQVLQLTSTDVFDATGPWQGVQPAEFELTITKCPLSCCRILLEAIIFLDPCTQRDASEGFTTEARSSTDT